ncbi:MAG: acyl carrier protein, partial [Clostridia bacterium]|nr:acyl carrier protein [Clostridia bacterium]
PDSDVVKDLGADSLDVVQMLMELEDQFGITVPEEEATEIKTVADIIKIIDSKN